MKKIVALVLAMVMVLGLATTAFGAAAYTKAEMADVNKGNALVDWDAQMTLEDAETDDEFAVYTVLLVAKKDTKLGNTEYEAGDDLDLTDGNGGDEWVIVDGTGDYTFALVDGKTVTYLAPAAAYNTNGWDAKATAENLPLIPDAASDVKCDTYYITSAADLATPFFWVEGVLYAPAATATKVFNVAGVAVGVAPVTPFDCTRISTALTLNYTSGARVVYSAHNYVVADKGNTYGSDTVTGVSCDVCKAEFGFAYSDLAALAAFGQYNYFELPVTQNFSLWVSYAAKDAVADAPATDAEGDKVESAETFDAGIAMYVGMSVMAAAGSAVVLKKKD